MRHATEVLSIPLDHGFAIHFERAPKCPASLSNLRTIHSRDLPSHTLRSQVVSQHLSSARMSASMKASTKPPQSEAAQMPEIPSNQSRADGAHVSAAAGATSDRTRDEQGVDDRTYEENIEEEYAKREGGA